jgi:hypothetical protein
MVSCFGGASSLLRAVQFQQQEAAFLSSLLASFYR